MSIAEVVIGYPRIRIRSGTPLALDLEITGSATGKAAVGT